MTSRKHVGGRRSIPCRVSSDTNAEKRCCRIQDFSTGEIEAGEKFLDDCSEVVFWITCVEHGQLGTGKFVFGVTTEQTHKLIGCGP